MGRKESKSEVASDKRTPSKRLTVSLHKEQSKALQRVISSAVRRPTAGTRILVFDDGGIRGLTMLLLLQQLMYKVEQSSPQTSQSLPCEYFDLIAGSGIGGVIALFLGRLRMSVKDAIDCYLRIAESVYKDGIGDGLYKLKRLDDEVIKILKRFGSGNGEHMQLLDSSKSRCKTFVCVSDPRTETNKENKSRRLRSYPSEEPSEGVTVLDAIRSTVNRAYFAVDSASLPTFFSADDTHRSPIEDAIQETVKEGKHMAYALSLGAGVADDIKSSVPQSLAELAKKCESLSATKEGEDWYYRFNLKLEAGDKFDRRLSEYESKKWQTKMEQRTKVHLSAQGQQTKVNSIVKKMVSERALLSSLVHI